MSNFFSSTSTTNIIAFVSTIIACFSFIIACISAKASRDQIKNLKRANIIVSLELVRKNDLCLRIQNFGGSPAKFIKLNFEESFLNKLDDYERETLRSKKKGGISLCPNQSIYFCIGDINKFNDYETEFTKVIVEYRDFTNYEKKHGYHEEIILDFVGFTRSLIYNSPLDDISADMSEIKERFLQITNPIDGIRLQPVKVENTTLKMRKNG